ncbi:uncharacterised protein VP11 [Tai Forest reovirus]|uniref:Uncharacterized protein n=1 Tax=Tai Forest reovirus TaxID=2039230 RepID=A0A291B0C8_9REOV|nr:uncharacterised protein VP11 [Tai Forest reovirus]ATE86726.1 uncharacterised protein VP11 [Tai Forest reovirus]
MPLSTIVGNNLPSASVIFHFPKSNQNGVRRPERVFARPLVCFLFGIPRSDVQKWDLFKTWVRENQIEVDGDDDFETMFEYGLKIRQEGQRSVVLRKNAGITEIGLFGSPLRPGERAPFNATCAPPFAAKVADFLAIQLTQWCINGAQYVIEWIAQKDMPLEALEFDTIQVLTLLSESVVGWKDVLSAWTSLCEEREGMTGAEASALRKKILAALMMMGKGINLSGAAILLMDAQGVSHLLMRSLLKQLIDDPAPTMAIKIDDSECVKPVWRRYASRTGGRNYTIMLNCSAPGSDNVTYEDVDIV